MEIKNPAVICKQINHTKSINHKKMKLRTYLYAVLLLSGISWSALPAQLTGVKIVGNEIAGLPDTVNYGDTLKNLSVDLTNTGTLPLVSQLIGVTGQTNGTGLPFLLGSLNIPLTLPFNPGDTITVPLDHFVVSPQRSRQGSNVIVVWPTGDGVQPEDTLEDTYYVNDTTVSASDPAAFAALGLELYPNPVDDRLFIRMTGDQRPWKEASILDLSGRPVFRQQGFGDGIPVSGLAEGLYILRIVDDRGRAGTARFIVRH